MDERRRDVIVRKSGGGALMYSGGERRLDTLSSLSDPHSLVCTLKQ